MNTTLLDKLIAEVLASPKYRQISQDLVRVIGTRELVARPKLRDAVKETKNKLHQVGGSYLNIHPDYVEWNKLLQGAAHDQAQLRTACLRVMQQHASTRERLPILERFYQEIFGLLPTPKRVMDVACGLNPLALPWMPLAPNTEYFACDIYTDMVSFISKFLSLTNRPGQAWVCDVVSTPPTQTADVVLALKVLPVLEQVEKGAALRLLHSLNAPNIIVSFPTQSLGGRNKGMATQYEQWLRNLVSAQSWELHKLSFSSEVVFLVHKA